MNCFLKCQKFNKQIEEELKPSWKNADFFPANHIKHKKCYEKTNYHSGFPLPAIYDLLSER